MRDQGVKPGLGAGNAQIDGEADAAGMFRLVTDFPEIGQFLLATKRHLVQNLAQSCIGQQMGKKEDHQKVRTHLLAGLSLTQAFTEGGFATGRDAIQLAIRAALFTLRLFLDQPLLSQRFQGRVNRAKAGPMKMAEGCLEKFFDVVATGITQAERAKAEVIECHGRQFIFQFDIYQIDT